MEEPMTGLVISYRLLKTLFLFLNATKGDFFICEADFLPGLFLTFPSYIYYTTMAEEREKQKKIGYYLLGKTIGEGTFGKVKLATHTLTGQKVAIKILVKEKIIDVADVERVSRQIHILKLIRHPSIIQLYQIIQTSRHLFLVMQYVENGQLFDYIVKKTKLDELQACRFFKNIISGVSYLHQLNIVHRDLKPQNLLIDWKNGLKIVDFGLSNTYKAGEMLKTACGSPCYAAPQMISSKKYNGLEVDIWSCGVILFAMVCGYLPFEDSNTSQLYKKILSGEYVLPSFISPQFKDLLQKILNINPVKRYRIQQIFDHEWCKQVDDIPLNSGIVVGYHRIPVDKFILQKLNEFNFDIQYAQRCIEANKHNHITTTYYLLLKKHLRTGHASSADLSSPSFDYSSVQPFKRANNEKKYHFFATNQQTPLINLDNNDIRIHKGKKNEKHLSSTIKHQDSKIQQKDRKYLINTHNRSNNFFQKDKKDSQYLQGNKKFNDLRMYLKPSTKKKEFYSEAKRRQERRYQAQSLHCEPKENEKDDQNLVIRMNTQYSQQKGQGRVPARSKYQRFRGQNRLVTKPSKEKQ